jgi:hypothetical protein
MRNIVFAMALLICFICLAPRSFGADLSGVSGVYLCHTDDTQFLTLRQDATFVLRQRVKPPDKEKPFMEFTGKYQLNGETLTLILDDGGIAEGQLKGSVFTDAQGDAWVKKSTEQKDVVRPKYKLWFR